MHWRVAIGEQRNDELNWHQDGESEEWIPPLRAPRRAEKYAEEKDGPRRSE
jgi:hypothetical protein